MVNGWLAALIGAATGVISGMGIGGGTLLVLFLTAVLGTAQHTAAGINLLYFLGSAPSSLIFHARDGRIDKRTALWAALGGVVTAAVAAWLVPAEAPDWLRRVFGGLLLFIGVRELVLVFKSRHDGSQNKG